MYLYFFLIALLAAAVIILVKLFKPKKKNKNIFFLPYSQNAVTGVKKLSKIHKNRFSKEKIPENVDTIIIGTGISGLACGSLLSKRGKKVLLLEQCKKAGGFTHTFTENGYKFCSGVHYVPYVTKNGLLGKIYECVSDGKIEMQSFGNTYDRVVIEGTTYLIHTGDQLETYLCEKFPKEEKNIKFFISESKKILKEQPYIMQLRLVPKIVRKYLIWKGTGKTFLKYQKKTIDEVVNSMFEHPHLKGIFSYMYMLIGDYKHAPASLIMSAMISYNKGAYYPKNGCQVIAKSICEVINKNGGTTLTNAYVEQILIEKGKAVGVRMKGGIEIRAKNVISCAGRYNTFYNLLPKKYSPLKVNNYKPSPAAVYVYCGFNGSAEELGFPEENVIISDNQKNLQGHTWMENSPNETEELPVVFAGMVHHIAPNKDPKKCSVIIMTLVNYKWFESWKDQPTKNRGAEYEDLKEVMQKKMLDKFFKVFPDAEEKLEYVDSGSPVTVTHWVNYKYGESYGELNTVDSLFKNQSSPVVKGIKNFYLTGIDTFFVCGVNSGLLSGVLTAQFILKEDLFKQAIEKMKFDRKKK